MNSTPGFWVRRGVITATWVLPSGAVRERYRRELLAELHALERGRRAAFTIGVLSQAPSLRAAVAGMQPPSEEVTMTRKSPLCLARWHTYRVARTEDNQRYKRCIRCGKDHDGTPGGFDGYGGAFSSPSI